MLKETQPRNKFDQFLNFFLLYSFNAAYQTPLSFLLPHNLLHTGQSQLRYHSECYVCVTTQHIHNEEDSADVLPENNPIMKLVL